MITDFYRLALLLAFQAPAICIIVCAYVFFTLKRNGLTRTQFILIRLLSVFCILFTLCELMSGLINYDIFDWHVKYIRIIYNITYTILLGNVIILSEFCISKIIKKPRVLITIIRIFYFVVATILMFRFFSFNTKLFCYFGPNEEVCFGPLDDLQSWACTLAYIFLINVLLINFFDKDQYAYREQNGNLLVAIVFVAAVSIIYLLTYIPYITWMSYMFVVMYLYNSMQKLMVYSDELTTLNNRRRMLLDIKEIVNDHKKWSFVLIDVNLFKQINDKFGHNEGDKALKSVANVLKSVADENSFKAYRFGGDEFGLVLTDKNVYNTKEVCDEINRRLNLFNSENNNPYSLSVSCGYAVNGEDSIEDIQNIIELADQRMYVAKQESKR